MTGPVFVEAHRWLNRSMSNMLHRSFRLLAGGSLLGCVFSMNIPEHAVISCG
jgi:hypothetical protein